MSLTKIVNKLYFQPRRRELERYVTDGEAIQREVMQYLVERAKDTEYGRKHLFSTIKSYEDFVQNITFSVAHTVDVTLQFFVCVDWNILYKVLV